jgi:hypothetical protein
MMERATVRPPTPESKTPIGRAPISSVETPVELPDAEVMIIRE